MYSNKIKVVGFKLELDDGKTVRHFRASIGNLQSTGTTEKEAANRLVEFAASVKKLSGFFW